MVQDSDVDLPFPVYGSVRLDDQLSVHPVRYLRGLAAAVAGDGSQVFEHSRVLRVRGDHLHTDGGTVRAERIVVATHAPLLDRGAYFARLEAVRSYCVAARLRSGSPPEVLAINAGDPVWSIASTGNLLILSGQGHPTGERGVDAQRTWRSRCSHASTGTSPRSRTAGRRRTCTPMTGCRWSGRTCPGSRNLYVATGYRKWGLAMATAAATLLRRHRRRPGQPVGGPVLPAPDEPARRTPPGQAQRDRGGEVRR